MPIKKAAMKALRQSTKHAERNRNEKETIAYLRRMHGKALEEGNAKKAQELVKELVKKIDKATQGKVLKKNTGARIKSRLMKMKVSDDKTAKPASKKPTAKKVAGKKSKATEKK